MGGLQYSAAGCHSQSLLGTAYAKGHLLMTPKSFKRKKYFVLMSLSINNEVYLSKSVTLRIVNGNCMVF